MERWRPTSKMVSADTSTHIQLITSHSPTYMSPAQRMMNGIGRDLADRHYTYATFLLGGPTLETEPRTGSPASASASTATDGLVKAETTYPVHNTVAEAAHIFLATCTCE